jgi:hypothetical protein
MSQQHEDMVSVDVMTPIYYSFRKKTKPSSIYLSKRESPGMVSVRPLGFRVQSSGLSVTGIVSVMMRVSDI